MLEDRDLVDKSQDIFVSFLLYYKEHQDLVKKQNEQMKQAQSSKQPTIPRRFNPKK